MSDITPVEHCQCQGNELPGPHGTFWCQYHQCRKTQHYREFCQLDDDFRRAWNGGYGPGQDRVGAAPAVASVAPSSRSQTGVGTELSRIMGRCCKFPQRKQLDEWGSGCLDHIPAIVSWVQEFSLTFQKTAMDPHAVERLLRLAIARVEQKSLKIPSVSADTDKQTTST